MRSNWTIDFMVNANPSPVTAWANCVIVNVREFRTRWLISTSLRSLGPVKMAVGLLRLLGIQSLSKPCWVPNRLTLIAFIFSLQRIDHLNTSGTLGLSCNIFRSTGDS